MSAIFGSVRWQGDGSVEDDLVRMGNALHRHGQDARGVWNAGPVGLGHLLKRFTPEDAQEVQPLRSETGRLVLACDGRIDNRAELCDLLGFESRWSAPDSAIILDAFERWGIASLDRLAGCFAFALWDCETRRLILARSPVLAPPLFYHRGGGNFLFVTMPSALFAIPSVPRAIDESKLADVLAKSPAARWGTLYRDICRLPTGTAIGLSASSEVGVAWKWGLDETRRIRFKRDEDYIEAFGEVFERVVGEQSRSAGPVGVMMSGGLDSTAVATIAARNLAVKGARLKTFTAIWDEKTGQSVPDGYYRDETPFVSAFATRHDNVDATLVEPDGRSLIHGIDELFPFLERPFSNAANRKWIEAIYSRAQEAGVSVLLNGTQGNLTISRDGNGALAGLVREGRGISAATAAGWLAWHGEWRKIAGGLAPLLPQSIWLSLQSLRGRSLASASREWLALSPLNPDFASRHRVVERALGEGYLFGLLSPLQARQTRFEALSRQDIGPFDAAFRGRYSVDPRSPAADRRLAEFCLALPDWQFQRRAESRLLIRRAMGGDLPNLIAANQRRGYQAADWFVRMSAARGEVERELDALGGHDLSRRVLDLNRMRRMAGNWPDADSSYRRLLPYKLVLARGIMAGRFLRWFEP